MAKPPASMVKELIKNPRAALSEPQNREAFFLMVNTLALAGGGFLFWIVLTRGLGISADAVGAGYSIVALGTAVGVLAKGGFDTAILCHAPRANRSSAERLLRSSMGMGVAISLLLTVLLAGATSMGLPLPRLDLAGWSLVFAIGSLLMVAWMQDAYFVSDREARLAFGRNLAFSIVRLGAPVALLLLAAPFLVASAWSLALAFSVLLGVLLASRLPDREGETIPHEPFLKTTVRNLSSSAAEFLPGLLLTPIVMAIHGPEPAAYFGIAWTVAHLLFQISSAISRSTLVEFTEDPHARHPEAIRRGILQHLLVVVPAALLAGLLAPYVLGIFGAAYASAGSLPFIILAASTVLVSPWYLYLAVLRARENVPPLVLFPAATITALFILVPLLSTPFGLPGVSLAWCVANAPFGAWASWRLYQESKEVKPDDTQAVGHHPHPG